MRDRNEEIWMDRQEYGNLLWDGANDSPDVKQCLFHIALDLHDISQLLMEQNGYIPPKSFQEE